MKKSTKITGKMVREEIEKAYSKGAKGGHKKYFESYGNTDEVPADVIIKFCEGKDSGKVARLKAMALGEEYKAANEALSDVTKQRDEFAKKEPIHADANDIEAMIMKMSAKFPTRGCPELEEIITADKMDKEFNICLNSVLAGIGKEIGHLPQWPMYDRKGKKGKGKKKSSTQHTYFAFKEFIKRLIDDADFSMYHKSRKDDTIDGNYIKQFITREKTI